MRYLILIAVLMTSVSAKDSFLKKWESRVQASDNPESKAMDMCSDWVFDHRGKLRDLDASTLEDGKLIMDWMADHDIPLPRRARLALDQVKTALAGAGRGRVVTPSIPVNTPGSTASGAGGDDGGLSGELLPRSQSELHRQAVDDLRHPRIPEPTQR